MAATEALVTKPKVRLKNQKAWNTVVSTLLDLETPEAAKQFAEMGIPLPGGMKVTQMYAMTQAMIMKASDPDSKDGVAAFAVLRDTAGGKPTDKIQTEETPGTRLALKDIIALQNVRAQLTKNSQNGEALRLPPENKGLLVEGEFTEEGKVLVVPIPSSQPERKQENA